MTDQTIVFYLRCNTSQSRLSDFLSFHSSVFSTIW